MSTNSGSVLSWDSGNPETVWHLSSSYTTNDLSNSVVDTALGNGINEWSTPGCTNFNAVQGGDVSSDPKNHNDSNNTIGFLGAWPPEYGSSTLAVTVPQFYTTGEIFAADMFYNGDSTTWIAGSPGGWGQADLESVAVHEFGHWIGFEHSNYPNSSLNSTYSGGISERTLTCDDTEGVCSVYQSGGTSCTSDRYCACNESCTGGFCGGVVGDDDDAADDDDATSNCAAGEIEDCNGVCAPANWVGDGYCDDMTYAWPENSGNLIDFNCSEFNFDEGDCGAGDDDDATGPCEGDPETVAESEPNNQAPEGAVTFIQPGGGDLTFTGSVTCGNDGETYTGDYDWFSVEFPCEANGRYELDWSGDSYVDFYLFDGLGNQVASEGGSGDPPISDEAAGGGRMFLLVVCGSGETTNYQFTFDWAPFDAAGDDDDASDDDDAASDDDDAGGDDDDDDDDDDDSGTSRRGCACSASSGTGVAGGGIALLLLLGLGWARRSSPAL